MFTLFQDICQVNGMNADERFTKKLLKTDLKFVINPVIKIHKFGIGHHDA